MIERFALQIPVSRFLVNTPSSLGGIGSTTGLFPALTLGCGAVCGSSSSNNIGPLDLVNIRRVAWGEVCTQAAKPTPVGDDPHIAPAAKQTPDSPDPRLIDELTRKILQRLGLDTP